MLTNPASPCAEDDDDDWETADLKLSIDKKEEEAWSDEEGHDAHKRAEPEVAVVAAPAPPKPKTGLALKIEERERREVEEAKRKAELRVKLMGSQGGDGPEDITEAAAEKMRLQQLEEAADLDSAIDTFGLTAAPKQEARPTQAMAAVAAAGGIEAYEPKSDEEFAKLAEMMATKLNSYAGSKGHGILLKSLLRAVASPMSSDECKDVASFLSVLSNDKIKAERDKDKKKTKAKGKGKLNIAASKASDHDLDDIGDGGGAGWGVGGGGRDDDFDFM